MLFLYILFCRFCWSCDCWVDDRIFNYGAGWYESSLSLYPKYLWKGYPCINNLYMAFQNDFNVWYIASDIWIFSPHLQISVTSSVCFFYLIMFILFYTLKYYLFYIHLFCTPNSSSFLPDDQIILSVFVLLSLLLGSLKLELATQVRNKFQSSAKYRRARSFWICCCIYLSLHIIAGVLYNVYSFNEGYYYFVKWLQNKFTYYTILRKQENQKTN